MKYLRKISAVLLLFTMFIGFVSPFNVMAQTDEFEILKQETGLSDADIQTSLNIISNNYDLFYEFADHEVIESYMIENENIALLKYYINTVYLMENRINQHNPNVIENKELNDNIVQPQIWGILIKQIVKNSIKKKMGDRIEKEIGDEVMNRVVPKAQNAAANAANKYGYNGKYRGPEQSSAANGINQGEHILELYDGKGNVFFKLHVYKNPAGNHTRWHWHEKDKNNFGDHLGNIDLYHNSLPKWGSK